MGRYLFALLKCVLEPTTDPVANYELGVRWVRAQQSDRHRRTPKLWKVLRLEIAVDL